MAGQATARLAITGMAVAVVIADLVRRRAFPPAGSQARAAGAADAALVGYACVHAPAARGTSGPSVPCAAEQQLDELGRQIPTSEGGVGETPPSSYPEHG